MNTLCETIKCPGGYKIEVHRDEDPSNPRTDYDNLGTFWAWDRRSRCGDVGAKAPALDPSDYDGWEAFDAALAARPGVRLALPVFKYEHGGVMYSTKPFGCSWDSGRVGVIFAEGDEAASMTEEQLRACLTSEIEMYSNWANGSVYGCITLSPEGEQIDSCWGFYGDDSTQEGVEEAKGSAARHAADMLAGERLVAESFAL